MTLSCRGTEPGFDRDNLITVAWAGVVNSHPPMVSVSIRPSRHSYAQHSAIRRILPEFNSTSLSAARRISAASSGRDGHLDKFAEMRLHAREI